MTPLNRALKGIVSISFLATGLLLLATLGYDLSLWRLTAEVALFTAAVFAYTEIFVKDDHYTLLYDNSPDRTFNHVWFGAEEEGIAPAMGNMVFTASEPFVLLIGLRVYIPQLSIDWFHCYGSAKSVEKRGEQRVVVRTWLGKGPCKFVYQTNIAAEKITVDRGLHVDKFTPQVVNEPHWYQRWPFYIFG